jgi:PAS domain S-box-containing protein
VSVSEPLIQASLLGEAIDFGPVLVFVADEDMRYVAVNETACRALGYTRDELLELEVTDVVTYPEARAEFAEVVAHRLTDGRSVLSRKDGSELRVAYRTGETRIAALTFYIFVAWQTGENSSYPLR